MTNELESINAETVPSETDVLAIAEEKSLQIERERAEIESIKQDTEERRQYASRVFLLVVGWLASMLVIVLLEGLGFRGFSLPPNVLLALVTTTTAGIVGTLTIVVRYLFTRSK